MRYLISLLLISLAQQTSAADLTLDIKGISDDQGQILAVVCDKGSFLTHHCQYIQTMPAAAGNMSLTFKDVAPGTWAVLAFHDTNMNSDLDMNMLGIPTEQFGFSNNPGFLHRPDFSESAFEIETQNRVLDIQLSK